MFFASLIALPAILYYAWPALEARGTLDDTLIVFASDKDRRTVGQELHTEADAEERLAPPDDLLRLTASAEEALGGA